MSISKREIFRVLSKLKSCPFCGGKAYLEQSSRAFVGGKSTRVAYVRCTKCEARTTKIDLQDYGCTSTSIGACKAAAEAWNMREGVE